MGLESHLRRTAEATMEEMSQGVRVRIPATTANLGPGFDCLGMALDVHNTIEMDFDIQTTVEVTGFGAESLSSGPEHLVARSAMLLAVRTEKIVAGWKLRQHNDIPLARGMGSSSAAIVGGLVAANALLETELTNEELLKLAVEIEGHPDNVAPALLGGLVVCCTDEDGLRVARFEPPAGLKACLAIPDYEVSTEAARKVMPAQIPHGDGVFNTCHSTAVLAALVSGDMELLGHAMKDRLHEPYRAPLVKGMDACVAAAKEAGAHAAALSGSGPTIVAFATENEDAIVQAMVDTLRSAGVSCRGCVAGMSREGAGIVVGGE